MADLIPRGGQYVKQPSGYRAFMPASLPPMPALNIDGSLIALLSRADQAVGRLDGVTQTLPNPNLFVAMYVRREAVFSSQIEGTQSTLEDVLTFELDPRGQSLPQDVEEVVNYVRAMNYGLDRLTTLPLSLRLIREIHAELLRDGRGAEKHPGEFRTTQNWIGSASASISQATFVPPPATEVPALLSNLEHFLHGSDELPVLIRCGLAHVQFETIHPFLNGNGRVGRLLITFLLVHQGVLHRPLLYLSYYLKRHRAEYYDRLMAVRETGNWEAWLRFFLRGVAETAEEATTTATAIISLREAHREVIQQHNLGINGLRLLDLLFQRPLVNITLITEQLGVVYVTANRLVEQFVKIDLLREITGGQRFRIFRYDPYWELFEETVAIGDSEIALQITPTDV